VTEALHTDTNRWEQSLLKGTFVLFTTIYCLISLVNHYQFRTFALDLGLYNHALYELAHFKMPCFLLDLTVSRMNFLGDHFSPIMFLYVPFYYLFGSYTLLFIQIASVLFGGYGIYKYCKCKFPTGYLPLIITFQFFSIWGIFSALSYDFHNNVVGAMFVPWLIYFHEKQRKKLFLVCFVLILLSKENMALWMAFIMLGIMVKDGLRNYKTHLLFEFPLMVFALVYFVVIVTYVMPPLENMSTNYQLGKYAALGNTVPEIIGTMVKHPATVIGLLLATPQGATGIKLELLLVTIASGGLALLYRPYYLLMLIPIFLQKLLSNNPSIAGVDAQYSIELVPILSLALADSILSFKSTKAQLYMGIFYIFTSFGATIYLLDHQQISNSARFYTSSQYNSDMNTSEIYKAFKLIPDDAPLSASSAFCPHMANREKIYAFPNTVDAQYIAILDAPVRNTYPLNKADYTKLRDSLKSSGSFATVYDANQVLILKRK